MEELIEWLETKEKLNREMISDEETSDFNLHLENDNDTMFMIKEYLNDYHKLAKDYRILSSENRLLKLEKMELEGRNIYEDMRMKYRANRRKWGGRLWR
ncbi:TPA: hypothetical protein ACLXKX_001938 [Streptococcus pneumoniae]|nr:phage replication initiation protein [Streptococcus pneumoniae]